MARRTERSPGTSTALIAAVVLANGTAAAQQNDPGLYLFHLPVSRVATDGAPLGHRIEADLHVQNPASLLEALEATSIEVIETGDSMVRVELGSRDLARGEPSPRDEQASFVVDFTESAVVDLTARLRETHGETPSIENLVAFVHEAIAIKSHRRSFDLASQVARSSEGDCTEHAVLLAALARAAGRPARVVLGVMLIETTERVFAFGHAWTQIHYGERWQIADATRPELEPEVTRVRYLPLAELENEGPGYAIDVFRFSSVQPSRIENIRSAGEGRGATL